MTVVTKYLLNHITFWVPVIYYTILSFNFDILFQDRHVATSTSYSKSSTVMKVTIDLPVMFIITIIRSKYGRTIAASKVFRVIFFIQCNNVSA